MGNKDASSRMIMNEELQFWKGRAQYRLNDFDEALESFNTAISHGEQLPNRPERLYYSVANYYAGLTSEALQKPDNAKRYYSVTVDQKVDGDFMSKAEERLRAL